MNECGVTTLIEVPTGELHPATGDPIHTLVLYACVREVAHEDHDPRHYGVQPPHAATASAIWTDAEAADAAAD